MTSVSRRTRLAGIAVVAIVLAACGSSSQDVRRGAEFTGGPGLVRLRTQALYYWFPATGRQAAIGAAYFGRISSLRDVPVATCMASHGISYREYSAARYAATFVLNADLPDLQVISRTGKFVPDTPAVHLPNPGTAPAKLRAYGSDLRACQARIVSASHPDPDQLASALRDRWSDIVSDAESSTEVRATLPAFESCAEHAGVPASVLVKATANSSAAFGAMEAWTDGPISRAPTTPTQHAVERHWAVVFVRCARPVVAQLNPLLMAQQTLFFQQHDRQIHKLSRSANQYLTWLKATRKSFSN